MSTENNSNIYEAIRLAKKQFKPIPRNIPVKYTGTDFKYADFNLIISCIDEALSDNNLLLTFNTQEGEKGITTTATVYHTITKESLSSSFFLKYPEVEQTSKGTIKKLTNQQYTQAQGGDSTYADRYAVRNLFGLQTEPDTSEHQVAHYQNQPTNQPTNQPELTEAETQSNANSTNGILQEAYDLGAITEKEYEDGKAWCHRNGYSKTSTDKIIRSTVNKIDTFTSQNTPNPIPSVYKDDDGTPKEF